MGQHTVLAIPDLHEPFGHPHAYDFLRDVAREYKPDKIVCLGDEKDFHALGKWEHDPDGRSPGDEHKEGNLRLKELFKLFPEAQCCTSNHTARPMRKAFAAGLPSNFLKCYREFLEAPDSWSWHDRIVIDGVQYLHGEGFSGQNAHITAALKHRQSTVIGHIHSFAGVQYSQTDRDRIFGVNSGWLGDINAYAFRYGKVFPHKPVLGCTIIIEGEAAIFLPMKNG